MRGLFLTHHAELAESVVAVLAELFAGEFCEVGEGSVEAIFDGRGGFGGVTVGTGERFGEDAFDESELVGGIGGEFESSGGLGFFHWVAPEDGGAALGRDDAIDSVLLHVNVVSDGDSDRSARAAFADDDADDGDGEFKHFEHASGDGFADSSRFGFDTGVGGGGIDKGDDGHTKSLGHFEHPDGFSVAFGFGHGEVTEGAFLDVAAFLVSDDHNALSIQTGGPADDGVISAVAAVAIKLGEIGEDCLDVIEGIGSWLGAGEEDLFPGSES